MLYLVFGIVLTVICLLGTCCTGCLLYSQMLRPHSARGTWAVVWGTGNGGGLEQRVRSLMWLQSCGLLRCCVVLVDGGLDSEGRALAVRLAGRYPTLSLCSPQELEQCLLEV